jgi:hypothetical protein
VWKHQQQHWQQRGYKCRSNTTTETATTKRTKTAKTITPEATTSKTETKETATTKTELSTARKAGIETCKLKNLLLQQLA